MLKARFPAPAGLRAPLRPIWRNIAVARHASGKPKRFNR